MTIDVFTSDDEKEVVRLLSQAGLPTGDLTNDKLHHFLVAKGEDGSVVGAIGVEPYLEVGLLRSLVVHPSYRRKGLGKQLTDALESLARQRGIKTLYLLTTTAIQYFPRLGYQVTQRAHVPASIAKTEEFKNICPVSAVCMFKNLSSK